MKKTYNTPILTIVKLKMQTSLMEASLGMKNADAESAAMSREGGNRISPDWDEEE